MNGILLHAVAALLYAGLAAHFWRTRWRAAAPRAAGLARWERAAILVPLALHTWLLYHGAVRSRRTCASASGRRCR